jgi:multimeric flavodoxin WrbA
MKITVLMGSPNKKGSTHLLVDSFKKGAEESGRQVDVLDICHRNIHPCYGYRSFLLL